MSSTLRFSLTSVRIHPLFNLEHSGYTGNLKRMNKLFRALSLSGKERASVWCSHSRECWDVAEYVDCEPVCVCGGGGRVGDYRPEGIFFKSLFSQSLFVCWGVKLYECIISRALDGFPRFALGRHRLLLPRFPGGRETTGPPATLTTHPSTHN